MSEELTVLLNSWSIVAVFALLTILYIWSGR